VRRCGQIDVGRLVDQRISVANLLNESKELQRLTGTELVLFA
jgi:hypothetical protein